MNDEHVNILRPVADRGAEISADQLYRYGLWRMNFGGPRGAVTFIGFNPSTADADRDDATVRRCRTFALRWGFDRMYLANLFALRSCNPADVLTNDDPVGGSETDGWIDFLTADAELVVACWGVHGARMNRDIVVRERLERRGVELHALHLTKDGFPGHPLYLRGDLRPRRWVGDQLTDDYLADDLLVDESLADWGQNDRPDRPDRPKRPTDQRQPRRGG